MGRALVPAVPGQLPRPRGACSPTAGSRSTTRPLRAAQGRGIPAHNGVRGARRRLPFTAGDRHRLPWRVWAPQRGLKEPSGTRTDPSRRLAGRTLLAALTGRGIARTSITDERHLERTPGGESLPRQVDGFGLDAGASDRRRARVHGTRRWRRAGWRKARPAPVRAAGRRQSIWPQPLALPSSTTERGSCSPRPPSLICRSCRSPAANSPSRPPSTGSTASTS